ncbi:hypothetical protein Pla123a_15980 [Posidoniimonas polymericola]|uniref:Uncharacterized protein n=1 Tax=Posidoniimonas polymericola TaxID=2528002 RepID=A0A5C5YS65_9BACT|nr:hypothetical protein [Posidoniimonas polymericola]TWT77802.1 hypothetical protein Pla123a_15980 [Posidoniimonas polymericola]
MAIRFQCSQCGAGFKAGDSQGGIELPCPKCGANIRVPSNHDGPAEAALAPPDDPLDETESAGYGDTLVNPFVGIGAEMGPADSTNPPHDAPLAPPPPPPPTQAAADTPTAAPTGGAAMAPTPTRHVVHEYLFPQLHASFADKLKHAFQWGIAIGVLGFFLSFTAIVLSFVFSISFGLISAAIVTLVRSLGLS